MVAVTFGKFLLISVLIREKKFVIAGIEGALPIVPWHIGGPVIKGLGRGSKVLGIPTGIMNQTFLFLWYIQLEFFQYYM